MNDISPHVQCLFWFILELLFFAHRTAAAVSHYISKDLNIICFFLFRSSTLKKKKKKKNEQQEADPLPDVYF